MNICRTCLTTPAVKQMSELEKGIKEVNKSGVEIIMFCLDIEVTQGSRITTNLCSNCYKKIVSFSKFKALSLKNDLYLKSLDPVVQLEDQKLSVYVDENGIKHENFLEPDEFGPSVLDDCYTEIKVETNVKNDESLGDLKDFVKNEEQFQGAESDDEPLCAVQKSVCKNTQDDSKKKNKKLTSSKIRTRVKRGKSKPKEKPNQILQVCEECGKSVRNIKEHSLRHQPQEQRRMWQCRACPKVFATASGRNSHYKFTHLGLKPKCDICYKAVSNVKVHKMQAHNPEALPVGCVSCDRRFVSQCALDLHMISHTKDLKFECEICQKKFRLKHFVEKHIRKIHENEKNAQCDVCAKRFFDKNLLKKHIGVHSKEKPYKCNECGLALKSKATLKSHQLLHSGVTFSCEVCGRSFQKPENLRVHMVTHTKEKRFECRVCGVRFGRSHHRSRHELTAHQKHLKNE